MNTIVFIDSLGNSKVVLSSLRPNKGDKVYMGYTPLPEVKSIMFCTGDTEILKMFKVTGKAEIIALVE